MTFKRYSKTFSAGNYYNLLKLVSICHLAINNSSYKTKQNFYFATPDPQTNEKDSTGLWLGLGLWV